MCNRTSPLSCKNIDLDDQRIFLLKFAKPNHREQLVIDSGFRCHLTHFARATAAAPSAFVIRLRKFLKTRRVTSVSQIGTDRIIEFQFSEGQYRLFLEFYAGGNVVLTDKDLTILALLRIVSEGEAQEELRVGLKYSLENRQNYGGIPTLTKARVREGLQKAFDKGTENHSMVPKKSKKKSIGGVRKALATTLTEFPPMLIDHALQIKGFDPETLVETVLNDESLLDLLLEVLHEAQSVVTKITNSEVSKGFIVAKPQKGRAADLKEQEQHSLEPRNHSEVNLMYEDFHPFKPKQFEGNTEVKIIEFVGFNKTVDEFFSSIEAQKLESRLTEREEHAKKKLEAAKQDHEKRLGGLQEVQELNVRKAQAIEVNLQRVQEAINAVNSLIAQGMDWVEIARLIEMEQARHNPVAGMIKIPLKLYENTVTLLLAEPDYDEEDEEEGGDETDSDVSDSENESNLAASATKAKKLDEKRLVIDIDLALSPWSNARQYYDQMKEAAVKEQKTVQSSGKALKSTENKINADLKKGMKQEKELLRPVRKQFWFEKFYYFMSSDGYLVLGGKDAQQNEILYKKYLRKGDVYVLADLNGASSIIIKNRPSTPDSPIPPSTLSQAGTLSVCTSTAWDSKAVMSAWWVNFDQVSKIAPTGEYLTAGAFVVRGTKNYLPPAQLLLGFGVMFQVSDESMVKHMKHRMQDRSEGVSAQAGGTKGGQEEEDLRTTLGKEDAMDNNIDDDIDEEDLRENQSGQEHGSADEIPEDLDNDDEESEHSNKDDEDASESGSVVAYQNPLQSSGREPQDQTEDNKDQAHQQPATEEGQDAQNESPEEEPFETDRTSTSGPGNPSVRHVSAKERRLLRNAGQKVATSQTPLDSEAAESALNDNAQPVASSGNDIKPTTSKPQPQIRGKHGKKAKQKTKYAHQDEEDRALALRLLGSAAATEKAASEETSKAAKEAEAAAAKQRRREQHARLEASGREAEEARRLNMEQGVETLDEEEKEEMGLLENFIGKPMAGDEILGCLVVCGPWDALGARLKWRVKVQPGSAKKGKAVREILGGWGRDIAEREKRRRVLKEGEEGFAEGILERKEGELIKSLRDVEVVGLMPVGKVRVVMGGGDTKGSGRGTGGKAKRGGRGSKKTR